MIESSACPTSTNVIPFPGTVRPRLDAILRRPRLLIRAARAGLPLWRAERDLPRLMRGAPEGTPARSAAWLGSEELRLDTQRREGDPAYDLSHHVALLIALLAEAQPPAQLPLAVTDPAPAVRAL